MEGYCVKIRDFVRISDAEGTCIECRFESCKDCSRIPKVQNLVKCQICGCFYHISCKHECRRIN